MEHQAADGCEDRSYPLDLFLGGVAGVVVGVIVLALTGPGTLTCAGGACTGIDIVRVCAIVAIIPTLPTIRLRRGPNRG